VILRDPVHGLVAFEGDEERVVEELVDTPELQRLPEATRNHILRTLKLAETQFIMFSQTVGYPKT
jgi:hypothetical protein